MDCFKNKNVHSPILQLPESYACSLFSALIGGHFDMGLRGALVCSALCPYYFLHRQFSAFQLPLKHQQFFASSCAEGNSLKLSAGALSAGSFLRTLNFREQLLLQMPDLLSQFYLFNGRSHSVEAFSLGQSQLMEF